MLYFQGCIIYSEFLVYVPKMPWWVEPTPSLIRVNPKDYTGHIYLVLHQVKKHFQQLMSFSKYERWMKGYALNKWESTLNPVFMPMDTMYTLSWKLLLK